ncbi:response regulator transcription factor [Paenibacillus periandrae]|uniref:response regulator transcription factor n=1 Tax=Paenibacillus periandrae TaxID=1761741 RepID=UPI001F09CB14|nr:response regulator transcription factor [Paenibacillus periandrae]
MNDAKLLLVDDEPAILRMLQTVLTKEGFTHIDTESSAEGAIAACRSKTYDFILLDVMLPGQSGFDICPFIRATTDAPIFFITARTTDFDKLTGFAVGGDDYIVKPFNPLEVVARIKAHLRRYQRQATPNYPVSVVHHFGRFEVDEGAGELRVEGIPVDCPAQVFQLLLFLCKHPNRMFSKKTLYERVWGQDSLSDDNTVMVHIHRIRERIERYPAKPEYLLTVRGLGYKLVRRGDTRER